MILNTSSILLQKVTTLVFVLACPLFITFYFLEMFSFARVRLAENSEKEEEVGRARLFHFAVLSCTSSSRASRRVVVVMKNGYSSYFSFL